MEEARFDFDTGITVSNGGLNAPLPDMEKLTCASSSVPRRDRGRKPRSCR